MKKLMILLMVLGLGFFGMVSRISADVPPGFDSSPHPPLLVDSLGSEAIFDEVVVLRDADLRIKMAHAAEQAAMADFTAGEEAELKKLEKQVKARIESAKRLKIIQKADKILDEFGTIREYWIVKTISFEDCGKGISIERVERIYYIEKSERTLNIRYKGEVVFRSSTPSYLIFRSDDIQVYRPGEWIIELEEIFNGIEAKKAREKAIDLKHNFGL